MRALLSVAAIVLASSCSAGHGEAGHPPTPAPSPVPTTASPAPPVRPVDPLSPQPALESAPPPGRATCLAQHLHVADADLLTPPGQLQEVFAVRTSGPPCQLRGWPAVRLLGADGRALSLTARRIGTARTMTLSRATSVSFVLGTPRSGDCQDATQLVVRLPGTHRDLRAATSMQVCSRSLQVGPVERRADTEGTEH